MTADNIDDLLKRIPRHLTQPPESGCVTPLKSLKYNTGTSIAIAIIWNVKPYYRISNDKDGHTCSSMRDCAMRRFRDKGFHTIGADSRVLQCHADIWPLFQNKVIHMFLAGISEFANSAEGSVREAVPSDHSRGTGLRFPPFSFSWADVIKSISRD
jgi:hypothetical protein